MWLHYEIVLVQWVIEWLPIIALEYIEVMPVTLEQLTLFISNIINIMNMYRSHFKCKDLHINN